MEHGAVGVTELVDDYEAIFSGVAKSPEIRLQQIKYMRRSFEWFYTQELVASPPKRRPRGPHLDLCRQERF
jgi:hypothetical protein